MEPVLFYYGAFILVSLLQLASSRVDSYGGWNESPDTQYHIQTDEGEERYFKYQTKTGQYRKEKRLQDGTVVGTYGWVDPNGYLRLRDYIADNAGYRILKSRMLFVGDGADVGNSVVAAKNVPATGGELASPNSSPFNNYAVVANRAVYVPPNRQYYTPSSTPQPIYVPPIVNQGSTPASTYRLNLGPQYFPTSTPAPYYTPAAHQSPTPQTVHIYPSSTPAPVQYYTASTTSRPYTGSTPQSVHIYPSSTPTPVYYSSTPSSIHYYPSTTPSPIHYYPSSTPNVDIHPNADPKVNQYYVSSTAAPPTASTIRPIVVYSQTPRPVAVNYVSPGPDSVTPRPVSVNYESATPSPTLSAIGYTASTPSPQPKPQPISGKYANPVNNFITETEKNKLFYQYEQNRGYYNNKKRYVDYKPVDQEYDGISTVQNGFRYFLPKQYHEEQSSSDGQERTGSFGYVDPFGIRRVIYYNSSPGRGFVHRKNNRYVGHDAAPYDPRPS